MTTALPEANDNQSPDEHMQISRRFVRHAREELGQGKRLQASEKIWGAAQHALAAVGKERGWRTEDYIHKDAVANHLTEEFRNPQMWVRNRAYRSYHENFYRNNIKDEMELERALDDVAEFVNELESIRERGPQPFTITDQRQIDRLREIARPGVANCLQVGQTYTDGFVNQRVLSRYRRQWAARDSGVRDDTPPEGGP